MSSSESERLPVPELPEPAHPELDSMLARKFGKEVANYFSGIPLLLMSPYSSLPDVDFVRRITFKSSVFST